VPRHTFSLWSRFQIHPRLAAAAGLVSRTRIFATIDNSVVLRGYARVDVAGFVTVARQLRLQLNVENLFDDKYFVNADSNTNISFGFPAL
jgi:catecholate siderophore receptor